MNYRREIDGLRALAVLPVVLFHAGFDKFSGGFVGVDVFFVVSGYLITTIILEELEQGKFSIVNFYERRARRILPALFLVIFVCIPFAWFYLLPSDMKDFAESLVTVSVFASNILFWSESDYFDAAAEFKPLLHTWSLAVEEQYYIIFPLFLILLWRSGKRWILFTLGILFVASLAVAQWAAYVNPAAAFYLLPTRAWEFLVGAFAAFYLLQLNRTEFGRVPGEVAGWSGVALILYAVFTYSKATPFPGFYALVPTLGAALIILFVTGQTSVGKFLGNKIFVGIGLISYSAYLWHQPLFAFARHRSLSEPSPVIFLVLSFVAFLIAYFSWKFVELPVRFGGIWNHSKIFFPSVFGVLLFSVFGFLGFFTNGFEYRFSNEIRKFSNIEDGRLDRCSGAITSCILGLEKNLPVIAILGDSHSNVLRRSLSDFFLTTQNSAISYHGSWCAPLLDFGTDDSSKNPLCRDHMSKALKRIALDENIKKVVLVAQWGNYTQGFRWGSHVSYYHDSYSLNRDLKENIKSFERAFRRTLELLTENGKQIFVVTTAPEYNANVPYILSKNLALSGQALITPHEVSGQRYYSRNSEFLYIVNKEAISFPRITIIDSFSIFCPELECLYELDGSPLYTDASHLSFEGSKILANHIVVSLK